MHNKAIIREKKLKQIIKALKGRIRDLSHRVFGKKSEKKSSSKNEGRSKNTAPKRNRGQQFGSKGHGFTKRPDLPEKKEDASATANLLTVFLISMQSLVYQFLMEPLLEV